ncbi:MAG: glycosyltransferase [Herpetosiphonaceae bacterium]|nr:glycosyltransferase [Herpetosiphonaceae bacterium]
MRVLYAIPRYGAQFMGNETHGEVVNAIRQQGIAMDVLSFTTRDGGGGPPGWGPGFGDEEVYRHLHSSTLALKVASRLSSPLLHYDHVISMTTGLLAVTGQRRYDILHIEGAYPLGAVAALTQPIHQTPYIVTTTGGDLFTLPELNYGYGQYPLPRRLISLALRRAAWVRANSTLSLRLAAEYGANEERATVLPVSIGEACYPPDTLPLSEFRATSRATLAAQYGWNSRPLVMCVGRLFHLKAQELLIEALPALQQALGPVQLCIVGPDRDGYREFLEQTAQQAGVAESCTFTGAVPNTTISQYLAAADVLAVPSRLEGLNRVVIEAAAVGTPSVVSDGAGAAELIATYGCGLIVPRNSATALAHAIERILASPSAWEQLHRSSQALAAQQRASGVASALVTMYQRIGERPRGAAT